MLAFWQLLALVSKSCQLLEGLSAFGRVDVRIWVVVEEQGRLNITSEGNQI